MNRPKTRWKVYLSNYLPSDSMHRFPMYLYYTLEIYVCQGVTQIFFEFMKKT